MRNLYEPSQNYIIAGYDDAGIPSLSYRGSSYSVAAFGPNRLVLSGRIDHIPGLEAADKRSPADRLLEHLLTKRTFRDVEGQFYAIAIIDNQILAHRSRFCGSSVFFGKNFISDSLSALCIKERAFSLCETYALGFILDVPAWQYDGQFSPVKGLSRIFSNSTLVRKETGYKVELHEFSPLSNHYNPTQTHADAGHIILSALNRSIKDDLDATENRKIFCEMSGGLDSSFTAALLANMGANPTCYVYSFPDSPSHQVSINFAKSVAEKFALKLTVIDGNELSIPDLRDKQFVGSEPADFFWQGALFGPVINSFCGQNSAVFTGFGADQILNRVPSVATSLLRQGQLGQAYQIIKDIAKDTDRSTVNYIWQAAIAALPKSILLRLLALSSRLKYNPFSTEEVAPDLRHYHAINWLKMGSSFETLKELDALFSRGHALNKRFFGDCLAQPNLYYLSAPNLVWGPHLGQNSIWQLHPYCDSRLIESSFQDISWHLIHDWKNLYKQTLREAQKGLLPEPLRLRRRDDFSFDGFFLRLLRRNKDFLYQVAQKHQEILGANFNRGEFDTAFEQNVFGVQTIQTQKLNRFLAYALWAENFKKNQTASPTQHSLPHNV
jgi:hypothetical protein